MNYYNPYYNNSYQQQLNGKLVDTIEVVKTADVPIGGYGVFPKADFSEIYIKSWNPNGTTSIATFKSTEPINHMADSQTIILERINALEKKLDALIPSQPEVNKANEY